MVANTPNFGAVYLVAPDASLDDGKLDVIALRRVQ